MKAQATGRKVVCSPAEEADSILLIYSRETLRTVGLDRRRNDNETLSMDTGEGLENKCFESFCHHCVFSETETGRKRQVLGKQKHNHSRLVPKIKQTNK